MAAKAQPLPLILPARFSLLADELAASQIEVLDFTAMSSIENFRLEMAKVLRTGVEKIPPPTRRLNNGLLACAATLTHGFEKAGQGYQALAITPPGQKIIRPDAGQLGELILTWGHEWAYSYITDANRAEVGSVLAGFTTALTASFTDWQWRAVHLERLLNDLEAEGGLAYRAIPALLATLLHGKTIIVNGRKVEWRKVIGEQGKVFVISRPFKASYLDDKSKAHEGYFAYRLDFKVETQAGRFNRSGQLLPWVYLHLSCQRYANLNLKRNNFGRDVSILMAMNSERLDGFATDANLVRLQIERRKDTWQWADHLPELLSEFRARPLTDPNEILASPASFGDLDNCQNFMGRDEYYVVHAEGYQYGEFRGAGHQIKTGFSLKERSEVIAHIVEELGILVPDSPLAPDHKPTPIGIKMPLAMRDNNYVVKRPNLKMSVAEAMQRVLGDGKVFFVAVLWGDHATRELLLTKLRQTFLVADGSEFPPGVRVQEIFIDQPALFEPLEDGGFESQDSRKKPEFKTHLKQARRVHLETWRAFLREKVKLVARSNEVIYVLVERKETGSKTFDPRLDTKGIIREACAREGINSQLIMRAKPSAAKSIQKQNEARAKSAVLDLVVRQTSVLYGLPRDVFKAAGLPFEMAEELDVVGLYQRRSTDYKLQYPVATRLSSSGRFEVLLPESESSWLSVHAAAPSLGRNIAHARGVGLKQNPLKLDNSQLARFVTRLMTSQLERPTVFLIEADSWRNERGLGGAVWPQLKNEYFAAKKAVLDFSHIAGVNRVYERDDPQFNNFLGVIRIRTGGETPQYVTNRLGWEGESDARDLTRLSGFVDQSAPELVHYFSVGRLPKTQDGQDEKGRRNLYKLDADGANTAFKHQQMVELVPFFVHPELQTVEGQLALCRIAHYLRFSPSWVMGNTILPYPIHLAQQLVEDQLCILHGE